jgi:hypothetical protein
MMDFGHYLAKNHARKIPIKPKFLPGPGAQSWLEQFVVLVWELSL